MIHAILTTHYDQITWNSTSVAPFTVSEFFSCVAFFDAWTMSRFISTLYLVFAYRSLSRSTALAWHPAPVAPFTVSEFASCVAFLVLGTMSYFWIIGISTLYLVFAYRSSVRSTALAWHSAPVTPFTVSEFVSCVAFLVFGTMSGFVIWTLYLIFAYRSSVRSSTLARNWKNMIFLLFSLLTIRLIMLATS